MKILCDVCGFNAAAVLCCADEVALCYGCDRANKLAGKHTRFSLLSWSAQAHPLCDVCQEDRAILCHECDSPIHAANDLTMNHSRFFLTGTHLSTAPLTASSPLSEESIYKKRVSGPFSSPMAGCSSSISEYLIKMLPGYRVEDFLLDDSVNYATGDVFSQSYVLAPSVEAAVIVGNIKVASAADWNFSVPNSPLQIQQATSIISAAATTIDVANIAKESLNMETSRAQQVLASTTAVAPVISHGKELWTTGEVFVVPQLPSVPGSNKRPCCRPST